MLLVYVFSILTHKPHNPPHTHTNTDTHILQTKGWHSPTLMSHFPSLALCQHPAFPSAHAQFDPLLLGWQGSTLACDLVDLVDRCETASCESLS